MQTVAQKAGQMALAIVAAAGFAAITTLGYRTQGSNPDAGSSQASRRSFDVASVKKEPTSDAPFPGPGAVQLSGDSFTMLNVPVEAVIHFAYNLSPDEKPLGLPDRMAAERFDVEARAAGNPTEDDVRLMMQSLLADRFKLATRYETRQIPAYELVVAKAGRLGPQLRRYAKSEEPCVAKPTPKQVVSRGFPASCGKWQFLPESHTGVIRVGGRNMSMEEINTVFQIFAHLDRRVFNQTELDGQYDFILEWGFSTSDAPAIETSDPTFSEALQMQLGLKLEAETAPVKVLIVDHIEEPTPN